ncbi:MAG: tyrosine-type recombinase/integrase, partial [Boseongicola sp. SB0673_bin_14]|nr:tyrosine-type recombinase/integrase [Boseongicola sp. SB0673_bin_14]
MPEDDVEHPIQGITDLGCRTATLTAYGAGLRVSDVVALQVADIRGEEGLLRIRNGKASQERLTHLL